jgi:branched-chain amino acid transport system permease protein
LAQGSIYALIALGYTLVYGILLMINFAHGEIFMAGAFTAYFLAAAMDKSGFLNDSPWLAVPILIIFAGLVSMTVAVLLERIAYRPLRNSPRLVPLLTAIGASFFLQYTFRGFYGSGFKTYPTVDALSGTLGENAASITEILLFLFVLILVTVLYRLWKNATMTDAMDTENKEGFQLMGISINRFLMPILAAIIAWIFAATLNFFIPSIGIFIADFLGTLQKKQVFVFLSALTLMAALYWWVERTKMGKAMRAVSENKEVARLMGVNIDQIIMLTFAVGGFLAGAGGAINGIFRPQGVNFFMGFIPGIKAFTAAVLGGIGNVPGAMLGGLFLGVIEAIGPNLVLSGLGIPSANQLKDVIAFTMLVLVLIFRPQGIMGERLTEKKA